MKRGPGWRQEDLTTWAASLDGARLVVTRAGIARWEPEVRRGSSVRRGPVCPDRVTAQQWCVRAIKPANS
jgi:hypothetical protein